MGINNSSAHSYLIYSGNEATRLRRAEEIGTTYLRGEEFGTQHLGGVKALTPRECPGSTDFPTPEVSTGRQLDRPFLNHPDVLIIEPDPESKSLAITIGQIRELERKINLKPYMAASKVAIVKEAQRMTREAQNALLKTLEEPPAHSVLILTALQANLLLSTIVSRCQRVVLRPEIEMDIESEAHQTAMKEFLRILAMRRGERLSWVEDNKSLISSQQAAVGLLDSWISVLRDLVLIEKDLGPRVLNKDLLSFLGDHKGRSYGEALDEAIEIRRTLSTTNVNPRLAVETFLIEL